MGILSWIVFGLLAGAVAKLILPGSDPGGFLVTMLIGVVGGVLGGWISTAFGGSGISGFDLSSFVWAVIGTLILLVVYRFILHRTRA